METYFKSKPYMDKTPRYGAITQNGQAKQIMLLSDHEDQLKQQFYGIKKIKLQFEI